MANVCGPGRVLVVHQGGEMGRGTCESLPSSYDKYIDYIEKQATLNLQDVSEYDLEQLYTLLYGPLGEGEYYGFEDINGDGTKEVFKARTGDDGNPEYITVYGRDDEFQKTETSYEDWLNEQGPDLSELIEQYGEDVVNDLKGKYDELVDFIGNIPEDPLGSLKKMAEIFIEGATGIDPQCTGAAGPGTETELETWLLDCVNIGILVDIGIPGLPGLGGIFKNTTLRDIKEAAEKIGSTLEDFINGNPTCGEKKDQECTPEQILKDLGDWVVRSVEDIFGGSTDPIDIETILGKLGGIFGPILSGIIYDQFKDLINGEIEDVIGIPVIPFAPLQECEDRDLETIETSPGQYECGECKQEGFTPTGPRGECIDPNAVDPFDETQCVEEDYFNENKADCEAAGYVNCAGGENSQAQETTGGIIKGTLDDCDVIQDPQCSDVGTYNPDTLECDCPEGYEFEVETGGTCGEKTSDGGETYDPVCTEPRPTGEFTFELENQQTLWDQKCRATHCESGVPIEDDPDCYGSPPEKTCDNNAVNPDSCDQCENGESPDAHINSDCSEPLKATDGNPGDACTLYDDTVGVVDKNGDCKRVGQSCGRSDYGYTSSDNCDTGLGFNTSSGIIDSSGDCVCNTPCEDPNRRVALNTGACLDDCKAGWKKDAEGNCTVEDTDAVCDNGATLESDCKQCPKGQQFSTIGPRKCVVTRECKEEDAYTDPTKAEACGKVACPPGAEKPYADSLDQCVSVGVTECTDPNRNKNDDKSCADTCTDGSPAPESGLCPGPIEECVTPDGTPTGAIPPDCTKCPTGQDFNTDGICVDTVLPETCSDPNAVNDGQEGPCECKPGFSKDPETLLCVGGTPSCDNGATEESGCDTCPDGTSVLEYEDGMCPSEPPVETCENGATDYPTCTTCPEGQSMDAEGNCVSTEEPPPPETGGGGGGGGGGMMGAFTPFLAGISYTPQAVPEPEAPPQKDYMAELDNLIKRSLFEGIA